MRNEHMGQWSARPPGGRHAGAAHDSRHWQSAGASHQPQLPLDGPSAAAAGPRSAPLVAIVEDHALLAEGMVFALSVVGITARRVDGASAHVLDEVLAVSPDLVLLDLAVDDDDEAGLRVLGPLCERGIPVIVVTAASDRLRHARCIDAGALAVVHKSEPMATVVDAVQRALHGEALLGQTDRLALLMELDRSRWREDRWRRGLTELTPREQQVLAALVTGQPAGRIAHETRLSVATVRSHIRSILSKLGVHSQLEAVALVARVGWRPDDATALSGIVSTAG